MWLAWVAGGLQVAADVAGAERSLRLQLRWGGGNKRRALPSIKGAQMEEEVGHVR